MRIAYKDVFWALIESRARHDGLQAASRTVAKRRDRDQNVALRSFLQTQLENQVGNRTREWNGLDRLSGLVCPGRDGSGYPPPLR